MAARGPQNGRVSLERRSKQLSLNKFFDPSTPSMRKGNNREQRAENRGKEKTNFQQEFDTEEHELLTILIHHTHGPLEHFTFTNFYLSFT